MDWVHCNVCITQPKQSGPNFSLTSCGHIFCEKCESTDNLDKCKACRTPCSVTKLDANLKSDVRSYFDDSEETMKKLIRTIRFQKDHRFRLCKHRMKINETYMAMKDHVKKLEAENNSLKRELERYKQSKAVPSSRTPEFNFTQHFDNRKKSPLFNRNRIQNLAQRDETKSSFRLPDIQNYQHYRNVKQRTPNESSIERYQRNQSANVSQKKTDQTSHRAQYKFPSKTPTYLL